MKKKLYFKGNLDLLTLEDNFFLFKFYYAKDFDLFWNLWPYFLNGKPFIFKKWNRDFHPNKENFVEILIWLKFPNLSLCYYNEKDFSKITRKIGIPLAIDSLIANNSHITFAQILCLDFPFYSS